MTGRVKFGYLKPMARFLNPTFVRRLLVTVVSQGRQNEKNLLCMGQDGLVDPLSPSTWNLVGEAKGFRRLLCIQIAFSKLEITSE